MRKKLTLSIDEDVYRELKFVPRGFSVSEFVTFMLKGMLKELQGKFPHQEEFEKWVNSDPELKRIREGIKEAWGPAIEKVDKTIEKVKRSIKPKRK
jgi:predicted CopG family antitoxin